MHYTLASTREYGGMQSVDIDENGNKYVVAFYNKGKQEAARKTFDTLVEALEAYQWFVRAFITGEYSYEDRKNYLT